MSLSRTIRNKCVRRAITFYLMSALVVATLAYVAAFLKLDFALTGSLIAAAILVGFTLIVQQLSRLSRWEQRLESLSGREFDVLTLPTFAGSSHAEFGWNQLVQHGKKWQTLSQLEKCINEKLTSRGTSDSAPLLDAMSDGVAAIDDKGTITFANIVLAAICGKDSSSELVGQSLAQVLGVDESVTRQLQDTASPAAIVEWSSVGATNIRTFRGSKRPATTGDGQTCCVWTIRDITQLRLAESMREKFLAAATHEFRTPLANIRAYAESLDLGHDIDAEGRKRFYNVIQSESLRLSQLVDDLLDISRMQAGAFALESRETDLGRLVEEASTKVLGQMREKQLQFRSELPPKFPKATVDKSKLTAALINLLGNAVKYTPAGGRVTFRVDVAAEKIQFSITDTGIGIASEELPHVFDRFFRSNDDRVRDVTGSGLGLALAQEIARLHGGDIAVESTLNKGSTFRMSIPLGSAA
jgi:two-component system, OmpR family, phosphate regulon sensor histidine kinase PhoR